MTKQFIQMITLGGMLLVALTGCDGEFPFPGEWSMVGTKTLTIAWQAHDGIQVDARYVSVSCDLDVETQGDINPFVDVDQVTPSEVHILVFGVDSQVDGTCAGTVIVNDIPMTMFADGDDESMPNEENDPGQVLWVHWEDEGRDFREGSDQVRIYSR